MPKNDFLLLPFHHNVFNIPTHTATCSNIKIFHNSILLLLSQYYLFRLDDNGKSCSLDENYSRDKCVNEEVETKSLQEFNCTTPFGPNKAQICQDPEVGVKVNEIYIEKIEKHRHNCLSPCSFLSIMATKTKEIDKTKTSSTSYAGANGQLSINFKENIKVNTSYFVYSGLTLIAEIGGYVGLFLGVSINQVTNLIEWIFTLIKKL